MKNKLYLVAYQGGGYDGCIWEWNYALLKNKEYISLHHSGYAGCKTMEEFEDMFEPINIKRGYGFGKHGEGSPHNADYYVYPLEPTEDTVTTTNYNGDVIQKAFIYDCPDFVDNHNPMHVVSVGTKLQEHGVYIHTKCPMCKNDVILDDESWQSTPYTGDGGIGIILKDYICNDCYSHNTCGYCGEFIDPSRDDERLWEDGCIYCEHDKHNDYEGQREKLVEAFNAGSNAMPLLEEWIEEYKLDIDLESAYDELQNGYSFCTDEYYVEFWMNKANGIIYKDPNQLTLEL